MKRRAHRSKCCATTTPERPAHRHGKCACPTDQHPTRSDLVRRRAEATAQEVALEEAEERLLRRRRHDIAMSAHGATEAQAFGCHKRNGRSMPPFVQIEDELDEREPVVREAKAKLERALHLAILGLTKNQRFLVRARFGMDGKREVDARELAVRLGRPVRLVAAALARACRRLKAWLRADIADFVRTVRGTKKPES